jgi:hypothetical protein
MGRHSHPDESESESEPIPPVVEVRSRTTAVADLQLVLRNPRLSAACAAAALVPFAVYFIVIVMSHKMHLWALFLGAPLILAGVLVGAVLDRAYGRLAEPGRPAVRVVPAVGVGVGVAVEVSGPASAAPAALSSHSVEGAHP